MTEWSRSFPYLGHVHFVHISPIFASPEGEGFPPSPMVTLNVLNDQNDLNIISIEPLFLVVGMVPAFSTPLPLGEW
jgi:hypothetical protein